MLNITQRPVWDDGTGALSSAGVDARNRNVRTRWGKRSGTDQKPDAAFFRSPNLLAFAAREGTATVKSRLIPKPAAGRF